MVGLGRMGYRVSAKQILQEIKGVLFWRGKETTVQPVAD